MKKFIQFLCSLLFATSISCPAEAVVIQTEDPAELRAEECVDVVTGENYQITLVRLGLDEMVGDLPPSLPDKQVLFISDTRGKIIKKAQVVATIITPNGQQFMLRPSPFVGGYLLPTGNLPAGQYRVEVEAATNGQFVTEEFNITIV